MIQALTRNELLREDVPAHRELLDVGGEWVAHHGAEPDDVVREARAHGVRALHVAGKDLSFLPDLPDLEHLSLGDVGDVTPASSLPGLKSFSVVSWESGEIDASAWPRLTRFGVSEPPRGGGGVGSVLAHPGVEVLALRRFACQDLTAVTAPRLRELHLSSARLESLDGIETHADTLELLALSRVPRLASLAGLGALRRLEVLALDGARRVTELDEVAAALRLRLLDVGDQRGIASLAPLAGHPALEYVLFERTGDMSLVALGELPRLRAVVGHQSRVWDRDLSDLPSLHSYGDDDPAKRDYFALRLRY